MRINTLIIVIAYVFLVSQTANASFIENILYPKNPTKITMDQLLNTSLSKNADSIAFEKNYREQSCSLRDMKVEPIKYEIVTSSRGEVISSTNPTISKGQNLFTTWSDVQLYDVQGQKLGKFQELPNKLSENSHLVLFHDKATCTVGFIARSLSSFITGDKARAETETNFEILAIEVPESELCEAAVSCIVDIFAGALFPGVSLCTDKKTCKRICKHIKKTIRIILDAETELNQVCGDVAPAVRAFLSDGLSLIVTISLQGTGCVLGCITPFVKADLNIWCKDTNKAKNDLDNFFCGLGAVAPEDASIEQGLANNVGEVNDTGLILISGEFKFDGDINFEDSMIIINDLLNERDGAGELTELTLDENDSEDDTNIILPIFLLFTPEANSEANNKSQQLMKTKNFESPGLSLFQMTIEEVDETNGVFEFNLVADRLVIPKVPVLCAGIPSETELTTSFEISDGITPPLQISANGIWRCSGAVPLELTLGMRTNSEGGGCSIANQGAPMSIPLYLLVLIVPVFYRFRRKVRFEWSRREFF